MGGRRTTPGKGLQGIGGPKREKESGYCGVHPVPVLRVSPCLPVPNRIEGGGSRGGRGGERREEKE